MERGVQKRRSTPAAIVGPYESAVPPGQGTTALKSQTVRSETQAKPKAPVAYQEPGPPVPEKRSRRPSVPYTPTSVLTPPSKRNARRGVSGRVSVPMMFEKPSDGLPVF